MGVRLRIEHPDDVCTDAVAQAVHAAVEGGVIAAEYHGKHCAYCHPGADYWHGQG